MYGKTKKTAVQSKKTRACNKKRAKRKRIEANPTGRRQRELEGRIREKLKIIRGTGRKPH